MADGVAVPAFTRLLSIPLCPPVDLTFGEYLRALTKFTCPDFLHREGGRMQAGEILEACVYADDLDAAERFYTSVLGMEVMARVEGRHVFFRCGGRVFLVFDPARTREGSGVIPGHGAQGAGHVCFAMRADQVEEWRAHLQASGVAVESDYTWPGGGRSLYFRDPAGNSLELGTSAIWRISEADTFGV